MKVVGSFCIRNSYIILQHASCCLNYGEDFLLLHQQYYNEKLAFDQKSTFQQPAQASFQEVGRRILPKHL